MGFGERLQSLIASDDQAGATDDTTLFECPTCGAQFEQPAGADICPSCYETGIQPVDEDDQRG